MSWCVSVFIPECGRCTISRKHYHKRRDFRRGKNIVKCENLSAQDRKEFRKVFDWFEFTSSNYVDLTGYIGRPEVYMFIMKNAFFTKYIWIYPGGMVAIDGKTYLIDAYDDI